MAENHLYWIGGSDVICNRCHCAISTRRVRQPLGDYDEGQDIMGGIYSNFRHLFGAIHFAVVKEAMNEILSSILSVLAAIGGLSGAAVAIIGALSAHRNASRQMDTEVKRSDADVEEKASETALKVLEALKVRLDEQAVEIKELRKEVDALSSDKIQLQFSLIAKDNEIVKLKEKWERERVELQSQIDQLRRRVIELGGESSASAVEKKNGM